MVAAAVLASGCQKTFTGSVSQPNPLRLPTETLRDSEPVVIVTGDHELRMPRPIERESGDTIEISTRYPLRNVASFTVVSRDRLRFHVQVEHKWYEWVDLNTWDVYLIDDRGRRHDPEAIEHTRSQHMVSMWDYERRTVVRNQFQDVVTVLDDGYKRRNALGSMSVFRGLGDVVFHETDIFTPEVKSVTLVVERTTLAFSFTWHFSEAGLQGHGLLLRVP
ncbi:hypothetical protein [Haliangium sp.]|uniref:hypothetical protein n=1 Tax=Haliangium sp. TaxID=2663208 RepID=UPI003D0AE932